MEKMLRMVLGAERSKHLPPIKRGSCADVYLTSSGQDQMVSHLHLFSTFVFFLSLQEKNSKKKVLNFDPRMLSIYEKKKKHHQFV